MKSIKKTVFTLNVNNYAPEIREITYPLLKYWAHKIGAEFYEITERKFPEWPVTYEKLQIFELGRQMENDWNIYVDADAAIHPGCPDWTNFLKKDTIAHWNCDMANVRWRYDKYFLRDGRNWGTGNWFTMGSDWCLDMWRPLEVTPEEAISNIFPTHHEMKTGVTSEHLVDDYALSCNIARFGLKAEKIMDVRDRIGLKDMGLMMHLYMCSNETKVVNLKEMLVKWEIPEYVQNYGRE